MGPELSVNTLRDDVEAIGDLSSHIRNLNRICRQREEILLQKMAQGADVKRLRHVIQIYRSTCSSCEPAWDNFQEIRDRALFWFNIARLGLACSLWRLNRTPFLCRSMAMRSLQALEILTPGVLDAL